jgi:hypothetical protein
MGSHTARLATAYKTEALTANDSDTVNLPQVAQALFITGAGNLRYIDASGADSGSAIALPVGVFPVQIRRIYATGLTATGIVMYDKDPG